MTLDEFTSDARAAGWPDDVIESFWHDMVRQNGHVVLVHKEVISFRTEHGARQSTYRGRTASSFARANKALDGVPLYIKPERV